MKYPRIKQSTNNVALCLTRKQAYREAKHLRIMNDHLYNDR